MDISSAIGPKTAPDGPKTVPDGPKTVQDGLKMAKMLQHGPKRPITDDSMLHLSERIPDT